MEKKYLAIGLGLAMLAGFAVVPLVMIMATASLMVPTAAAARCQTSALSDGGLLPDSEGLRVMSYNIRSAAYSASQAGIGDHADDYRWSVRGPVIAKFIAAATPDVIGLQEAGKDRRTHRRQLDLLESALPGYTWLFAHTAGPIGIRSGAFEVLDKGRIRLNWKGKEGATLNRWAQWAKLRSSAGATVVMVNLHAQYMQTSSAARARSRGWDRLVAGTKKVNPGNQLPMVVVGDFNAHSDETRKVFRDHLAKLPAAGWADATGSATQHSEVSRVTSFNGWGDTINGKWYYKAINRSGAGSRHIDYVWTAGKASSPAWQIYTGPAVTWKTINGTRVPFADFIPSDHWPILAQVLIGESATTPLSALPLPTTVKVSGYNNTQVEIAAQIVAAGKSMGLDTWTITVGVMTGIGESSLRNLDYGDAAGPDSRGVFQQRSGWGPLADRMNPYKAALKFFQTLAKVPGYHNLAPTIAAHRTQRNADPNHYARHWPGAVQLVAAISKDPSLLGSAGDGTQPDCEPGTSVGDLPALATDCPPSGSAAEQGLELAALRGLRCTKQAFPQIKRIGGRGGRPIGASDHPRGLAVDFMIDRWRTTDGNQFGWQVAKWAQANAKTLKIKYIIWDAKKWNPEVNDEWRPYTHPMGNSSPTLAHKDHVHISYFSTD